MHFIWAIFALMFLYTASTIINVPYSSLTPELTSDYNEQSSLNGYRFGCAVFGTIAGAGAVEPLVQLFARPGSIDPLVDQRGFSMMGLILGSVMMIVTFLTFLGTKEKKHSKEDLPTESFFNTFKGVFHNKPYLLLLLTYALHMTGITFLTTILAYYTRHVLNRPDITTIAMILLLVTAMLFIPVSVLVSKKIGKKSTYQICFAIIATACGIIFALGKQMSVEFFFGVMVFAGIGVGFSYVAPFAMIPDVIEYDAAKTGQRKEGAYYGMWTLISKMGTAFAIFIAGRILELGGYISHAGEGAIIQPASVVGAVRLIIGPIPIVILVAAIIVIQFYPLDKKEYRERGNRAA
jgi:GPH family glycoside/pentoside/hexuronide:cation symporter